jgi:hypothetical protein
MSATGRSGSVHPENCPAVSLDTPSFVQVGGNITVGWHCALPYPVGSKAWIWGQWSDGTLERDTSKSPATHSDYLAFTDFPVVGWNYGWVEARGPTGELLGATAKVAFTSS